MFNYRWPSNVGYNKVNCDLIWVKTKGRKKEEERRRKKKKKRVTSGIK